MAGGITIIADRSVQPTSGTTVDWGALVERLFRGTGYHRMQRNATYLWYGRLMPESEGTVYDLIVVAFVEETEQAENHVTALEVECGRIRRELLQGKRFTENVNAQTHHFITLHKPLIRYSYTFGGKPIGFSIRPLIITPEPDQWDYFAGQNSRIDLISSQALDPYLSQHQERLTANRAHFIDRGKYKYWRIANRLIDYGHFPLIGVWVTYLFFAIFQATFPLSLGGLFALTGLVYGGYIGFSYLAYHLFQEARKGELQENLYITTPAQAMTEPFIEEYQPIEEVSETPEVVEALAREVNELPQPPEPSPPHTPLPQPKVYERQGNRYYISRITRHVRKLLPTQESKVILKESEEVLRNVYCWILAKEQRELPHGLPRSTPLLSLLQQVQSYRLLELHLRSLIFWTQKIHNQTPFDVTEIHPFKEFILQFLHDLRVLPDDLQKEVYHPPSTPSRQTTPSIRLQTEVADLAQHVEAMSAQPTPAHIQFASEPIPPPNPSLDKAMRPRTFEGIEMSARDAEATQQNDKAGPFCRLIADHTAPTTERIVSRFVAETKDLHSVVIRRIDASKQSEAWLREQLHGKSPPVVQVGCGATWEVISYGERGNYALMHDLIASYTRQSIQSCSLTLRGKEEDSKPQDQQPIGTHHRTEPPITQVQPPTIERPHISRPVPVDADANPIESTTLGVKNEGINQRVDSRGINEPVKETEDLKPTPVAELTPETQSDEPPNGRATPGDFELRTTTSQQQSNQELLNNRLNRKLILDENLKQFQRGSVIIDGSNVAYLLSDKRGEKPKHARLSCVLGVVKALIELGISKEKISVFFDANIEHKLIETDKGRLTELLRSDSFQQVPSGDRADAAMIQWAETLNRRFIVISKDQYKKNEPDWFRNHRIGVMLDPENQPLLVFNSIKDLINTFYGVNK